MLKTGEVLVDKILDAVAKMPDKGLDKALALRKAGQLATIYLNESSGVVEQVFGSTS